MVGNKLNHDSTNLLGWYWYYLTCQDYWLLSPTYVCNSIAGTFTNMPYLGRFLPNVLRCIFTSVRFLYSFCIVCLGSQVLIFYLSLEQVRLDNLPWRLVSMFP